MKILEILKKRFLKKDEEGVVPDAFLEMINKKNKAIDELTKKNEKLFFELNDALDSTIGLRNEISFYTKKKTIDIGLGDPSPVDTEARKMYVASVAGFFKDYFTPKLKQMTANTFSLLEPSDNDRDYDQSIKGAIYALREIQRWGEIMENEHMANLTKNNN